MEKNCIVDGVYTILCPTPSCSFILGPMLAKMRMANSYRGTPNAMSTAHPVQC